MGTCEEVRRWTDQWYPIAENRWYPIAESIWYSIAENNWYTHGCKLTVCRKGFGMTFRLKWVYLIIFVFIMTASIVFIMGVITYQALPAIQNTGTMLGGWNWPAIVVLDSIGVLCLIWIYRSTYALAHVTFTNEYISKPDIYRTGVQTIRWSDVTKVEAYDFTLYIYGSSGRLFVSPIMYTDPAAVAQEIDKQLDAHGFYSKDIPEPKLG